MVVSNALSDPDGLRRYFERLEYQQKKQRRPINKEYGADLPGVGEDYSASFGRAYNAQLDSVERDLRKYFPTGSLDLRAHVMRPGDHFRCHTDEQVGVRGFTITLSKGWKWDWGGLLVVMEGDPKPYLPRFNELVVIEGQAHFVTPVCSWAREPRYTLVGFGR